MTERVLIFLIVAATIVVIPLIGGVLGILRTKIENKNLAMSIKYLEMLMEIEDEELTSGTGDRLESDDNDDGVYETSED